MIYIDIIDQAHRSRHSFRYQVSPIGGTKPLKAVKNYGIVVTWDENDVAKLMQISFVYDFFLLNL